MIPKGLVIAVVTGMTAAVALGVYLEKINSQDFVFVEGPAISLVVEKQNYKLGEIVQVSIINSGTTDIIFSAEQPSLRIRALDGTVFFSTRFADLRLEPNQKYDYEWDQQKNDSSKIIEGRYVIDATAYYNKQKVSDSVTVNILK